MTGAVATIAVLPHTAEPTAISSPSRPSIADEAGRDQDDDERQRHRDEDQPGGRQSDPGDLAQAEPRPEQDDAEAQDPLRGEREARPERRESRSGDRRHDDPEQEGDRDVGDDRGQERA